MAGLSIKDALRVLRSRGFSSQAPNHLSSMVFTPNVLIGHYYLIEKRSPACERVFGRPDNVVLAFSTCHGSFEILVACFVIRSRNGDILTSEDHSSPRGESA